MFVDGSRNYVTEAKTMPVGDVRQFEVSITVSDLFCDGWRSLSPFLFPRDDHRGTISGLLFRYRCIPAETTFRPDRPPVGGTSTGHFLGLNPVFSPERTRQKIRDGSVLQLWMSGCPVKWGYRVLPEAEKVEKLCRIYGRP